MKLLKHLGQVWLLLIGLYLALGVVACLMPDKAVHSHILKTLDRGDLREDYPQMGISGGEVCKQDNFTDALILSQCWCCSPDSLWRSMMLMPRAAGPTPYVMTDCLNRCVRGEDWGRYEYPRYWHGGTFLTRLLLTVYDFRSIRLLLFVTSMLLLMWLSLRLNNHLGAWAPMLMVAGMSLLYLFVMQVSMQFALVLIVALGCSIHMCRCYASLPKSLTTMLVAGSLTAYFDLLTVPMLALGLPLAVWLVLMNGRSERMPWMRYVGNTALMGVVWAAGYGVTWVSKWVIATLTTGFNVFADAGHQVSVRANTEDFTRWDAVVNNIHLAPWRMVMVLLIVLLVLAVCYRRKQGVKSVAMLSALGFLPIAWYLFASNHSYYHNWFTYRALMVTVVSWLWALGLLVDWKRVGGGKLFSRRTH